ncbi:MAG: NADH-quinone oxidoreductase subunit M [Deltaproteobacteria bacterium]|nr:MAG: NADH-quinone oxidoreductase subunit M [Deltaproteobacteria bacterium]
MTDHVLSWIVFFPLIGAAVVLILPRSQERAMKLVSVVATFVPLLLAGWIYLNFDRSTPELQFVEHYPWIRSFNIYYFLGIDGLSAPMVLLTALLCFLCIFASWNTDKGIKGYFSLFLLLDTGMMGIFCSLDFFLFYIFWEVMLLPMYFLIGIWGGPDREYAAIKFFLYTLLGSVLILLAMLALYFATEPHTFDMTKLMAARGSFVGPFWKVVFIGLFIGFAIKVPIFPFHTWLPDAHVEAPTAISVILAGVLLKMGVYGLLRISYPILPEATVWFSYPLVILGLINIIYGALCAMAQKDFKKLVAYSSISHMGYCLLGMAAFTQAGMNGAVLQMFNHGTITGMLFLLVGVIYDRAHHRDINGFGGLATQMPIYAGMTSLAFFASLGLPGLSGFISEVLCFIGAFPVYRTITCLAVIGIIIGAAYFLWTFQRVFLGQLDDKYKTLPEINARELFTLIPLGIIVIILGVYPMPMLDIMRVTLGNIISIVQP